MFACLVAQQARDRLGYVIHGRKPLKRAAPRDLPALLRVLRSRELGL
jgi:hypothetical protein